MGCTPACSNGTAMDPLKNQSPKSSTLQAKDKQIGGGHYKDYAIQPLDYILANNIPWCEANVIKYVTRWRSKNGVEDLKKARHYLDLLIERQ